MAMTATCEPPIKHRDVEWHWLCLGEDEPPEPMLWLSGRYYSMSRSGGVSADFLYEEGWRYVGPARPPKEEE
jgi:hypothetical protein